MYGRHQAENAAVAVSVAEVLNDVGVKISDANISGGLIRAKHPGRIEYAGRYLFDGAHNAGGAKALAEYLAGDAAAPITLVFGAMREKNIGDILAVLMPLADKIVVTEPSNPRAASYDELLELLPASLKENVFATASVEDALRIADAVTPGGGTIVVTGSLYLVGEVKRLIGRRSRLEIPEASN